jgi:hypothetical protein
MITNKQKLQEILGTLRITARKGRKISVFGISNIANRNNKEIMKHEKGRVQKV